MKRIKMNSNWSVYEETFVKNTRIHEYVHTLGYFVTFPIKIISKREKIFSDTYSKREGVW